MVLPWRFWEKVNRVTGDSACWLWTAAKNHNGYGIFLWQRKPRLTHRLVLEERLGRPLLAGMQTLHSCDVRACVNPAHLSEGTALANAHDAKSRGRYRPVTRRGECSHFARLTESDVVAIRSSGDLQKEIAGRFGVSRSLISMIRTGKSWGHAPGPLTRRLTAKLTSRRAERKS